MTRVLVVDDDEGLLALERQILERDGHEVVTAGGGAEALSLLSDQSFGLVLLDVTMPAVSGFEVAAALRRDQRHRRTPVILLTGRTDPEATREGFKAGASVFLNKPVDARQLSRLVKSLVRECEPGATPATTGAGSPAAPAPPASPAAAATARAERLAGSAPPTGTRGTRNTPSG
jgi:DNA-binding response OmpR family regulator